MTNAPRYKALREAETRSLDCERFVPSRENDRAAEPRKTRTAALFSWIPLTKGNKPDILQLCGKDSFYEELSREKPEKRGLPGFSKFFGWSAFLRALRLFVSRRTDLLCAIRFCTLPIVRRLSAEIVLRVIWFHGIPITQCFRRFFSCHRKLPMP